ncbi:hypothetical protein [Leptolyngbya ohadii]|uniref:hypothetical protein n=1 Tax=Leptolyngbya ohadii TaxID=1962290 RepID=UPI001CEC7A9A|nr:hypothetical protein [Leptolyngbya ohadii]
MHGIIGSSGRWIVVEGDKNTAGDTQEGEGEGGDREDGGEALEGNMGGWVGEWGVGSGEWGAGEVVVL